MPARARKEYGPPTRSSQRVASRASSVAADEPGTQNSTRVLRPAKSSGIRKTSTKNDRAVKTKTPDEPFDADAVLDRLRHFGDYDLVNRLTTRQQIVLLKASAAREEQAFARSQELEAENQELAAQNERLLRERDAAKEEARKRHVRDIFLRDQLQQAEIQKAAEAMAQEMVAAQKLKAAAAAESDAPSITLSPPTTSDGASALSPARSQQSSSLSAPSSSGLFFSSSPAGVSTPVVSATPRSKSLLRRVLSGIASPFTARTAQQTPAPASQAASPESPLEKLPSSRKRAADQMDPPSHQPVPAGVQRTPTRAPATTPRVPATLSTITEHTEPTDSAIVAVDATPCRPRPITKVRAARQSLARTPHRAWASKTTPREPNADVRLERLQQTRMDTDASPVPEAEAPTPRPTKRVKVDHLLWIPHNRPGDSDSTFRAPDIDSDDEIEVDIDVPERSNMFDQSQAQMDQDAAEERVKEQNQREEQLRKDERLRADALAKAQQAKAKSVQATPQPTFIPSAPEADAAQPSRQEQHLEEARLRQEVHDVQQWLQTCKPEHVEGLKQRLQAAQRDHASIKLELAKASASASGQADLPVLPTYDFPSGIFHEEEEMDPEEAAYLAAEFHYGYLHWARTGQLLPMY